MTPENFAAWLRPGWYIEISRLPGWSKATLWRPAGERASQGFRVIAEEEFDAPDDPAIAQWAAVLDDLAASGAIWIPRQGRWLWMLPNPPPGFDADQLLGPA